MRWREDDPEWSRLYERFLQRMRRVLRSRMPLCEAARQLGWSVGQLGDRLRGVAAFKVPHVQDLIGKLGCPLVFASLVDLPAHQGPMPSILARFRGSDERQVGWLDPIRSVLAELAQSPPVRLDRA